MGSGPINKAGKKDFSAVCYDRHADLSSYGYRPSGLGAKGCWKVAKRILVARSQRGERRHCLVARGKICRPRELSGLEISSLKELGWALRMRWLWLAKTDPTQPWSTLPIQVPNKCQAFFSIAMQTEIGDGTKTLFWRDRWLHGQRVEDLAPRSLAAIPKRRVNKCKVVEALTNHKWISDIRGALPVEE
jgi:hypothetical protein